MIVKKQFNNALVPMSRSINIYIAEADIVGKTAKFFKYLNMTMKKVWLCFSCYEQTYIAKTDTARKTNVSR